MIGEPAGRANPFRPTRAASAGATASVGSLWSADPLSWLATSWLALGCAGLAVIQAVVVTLLPGQLGDRPAVQAVSIALAVGAFLVVHSATRPHRGELPERLAWTAVGMVLIALALSASGYVGVVFRVELWWGPLTAGLLLIALTPYSTAAQLARYGGACFAVAGALAVGLASGSPLRWPLVVTIVVVVLPVVLAIAGCIVFVSVATRLFAAWNERPLVGEAGAAGAVADADADASTAVARTAYARVADAPTDDPVGGVELVDRVDALMAARLSEPTAFVRDVLARGTIEPADQARARLLATALRSELVAGVDATWLARVVAGHPVDVDDPGRLADRLTLPQRTALRAMLDALLAQPGSGFVSGRIELKPAGGGTVAVGLRILSTLPEGRRVTFLAPYYVTLQAAVTDIRWRNGAELEVDFEVPLEEVVKPAIIQRSPAPAPVRPRGRG